MDADRGSRRRALGICFCLLSLLAASAQAQSRPRGRVVRRPDPSGELRKLHQDPPGCSENSVQMNIERDPADPTIINGTTVNYTVTMSNVPSAGGSACHATNMNVSFTCPGPTGAPTGATTVLDTNQSLNAGGTLTYPPVACVINLNPGVTTATARGDFSATVHLAPVDDSAGGFKTITVVVQGATATPTATETSIPTDTPTPTETETPSPTPSFPPVTPTDTPTPTSTSTPTDTPTATPSPTPTNTPTDTPTDTPSPTPTNTPTNTPSFTPTSTSTFTQTATPSQTPTASPTATPTGTSTRTPTPTLTSTFGGGGPGGPTPSVPIPTLSAPMIAILGAALAAVALLLIRRL